MVFEHCPSDLFLSQQLRQHKAAAHSLFNLVVVLQNLPDKESIELAGSR